MNVIGVGYGSTMPSIQAPAGMDYIPYSLYTTLTDRGVVTPYGVIKLDQHWFE